MSRKVWKKWQEDLSPSERSVLTSIRTLTLGVFLWTPDFKVAGFKLAHSLLSPKVCCYCLLEWQQRKEARGCMCKAVDKEGKLVRLGVGARSLWESLKSLALLEPGDKDTVWSVNFFLSGEVILGKRQEIWGSIWNTSTMYNACLILSRPYGGGNRP